MIRNQFLRYASAAVLALSLSIIGTEARADDPPELPRGGEGGCSSGGPGATSCSMTNALGSSCSVTCGTGYYACCSTGGPSCSCVNN